MTTTNMIKDWLLNNEWKRSWIAPDNIFLKGNGKIVLGCTSDEEICVNVNGQPVARDFIKNVEIVDAMTIRVNGKEFY